jgi:tRNA G10  N-methylase Trm11
VPRPQKNLGTHPELGLPEVRKLWQTETAGLFAHLHANKIRIKESDEEKIRTRFLKAKDKLVLLDSQINSTDELIDQIVYLLYGLTEDEIKIVEGTAK